MSSNEFVLRGPEIQSVPECSLGEYLLEKIKSLPQDVVTEIDAETGAERTLGQLLEQSIRLAEGLKKLGLEQNDIVLLMCRNSFEADEIVLATWLCGATISPADGRLKIAEMKHIVGLVQPKFVFCEENSVGNVRTALDLLSIPAIVITITKMDSGDALMSLQDIPVDADIESFIAAHVESPSSDLAGILCSSGTSGLPKGVGITHKNFIFQDFNLDDLEAFRQRMVFLQVSQFIWVTGVLAFLKSLTSGMKRILLRDTSLIGVLTAIDKYKAEATIIAPLLAVSMVNHPDFENYDVSSLKICVIGGSKFTESMGKILCEKWSSTKFQNCYGTTESSGCICANNDLEDMFALGTLTSGVELKITDTATGESLPANTLGEIFVRSMGIMNGYVNNEKATKESVDEDGWYHTGDLGYYDDRGFVYYVDRIKDMVKVMNLQVAPAEIENSILSVPGVLEVGVVGISKDGNVFELVGLIVKQENSDVTEDDIHSHIANSLSDYKKLTGGVFFVESLPKTSSGKLQKREVEAIAKKLYLKSFE